ncbi:uncharacterized protein LOC132269353 [Cornus florida]|uniref:uncharacterized protein LOC132269353 n=1 Tax=Cornus florida TaxID=4283 RepID=UPI0028A1BE5E|nr:uncharacterized protein LOC132269353 [Cornus florida]
MDTLIIRSSAKIFTKETLPLSRRTLVGKCSDTNLFRPWPFGVTTTVSQKPILLRHRTIQCVASSSHFSSETGAWTSLDTANIRIQTIQPSKTVHVKFQLEKKCRFGEHFFVVGNDPIIGSWNPSDAIPLTWSDGHIWTAKLDLPIGRSVQFKYILKQETGDIVWQPGPDRIFHTWQTENTIVVEEDWENAELQKIIEDLEDELTFDIEKETINIGGNVTHSHLREELMPKANAKYKPWISRNKKFITAAEEMSGPKEGSSKLHIGDRGYKRDTEGKNIRRATTERNAKSMEDDGGTVITSEEGHVLVPGLNPLQETSAGEAYPEEIGKFIVADASARTDVA